MNMHLSSSAFSDLGLLAKRYTCEGADVSPPLQWRSVPGNTGSLVIVVDDPDAPNPHAPTTTWVHWVLYNIPPSAKGVAEDVRVSSMGGGVLEGVNGWAETGYRGPCPPVGMHRYFFKLFALDVVLPDLHRPTKAALEAAMQGHILAQTELVGLYQRKNQSAKEV